MAIQLRDRAQAARRVTLMHKGNIMKFTEGAFRDWGYELAKAEFRDRDRHRGRGLGRGASPDGKVVINDRIADSVFQQVLRARPTTTCSRRRISTATTCRTRAPRRSAGSGMAPGANIGDEIAFFEATHGTAPKYAGKDMINPASVILSGVMMLRAPRMGRGGRR